VIDKVAQNYEASYAGNEAMCVHVLAYTTVTGSQHKIQAGRFEAWVCADCGFTEWYAKNANEALAQMAAIPNCGVRLIDTTPQRGPFR
jgi:predicted nucleic-acid-binding Zn-ribbon protein